MLPLVRDRKPIGRSTKDIFLHSTHQSLQQQKVEKVCRQQKMLSKVVERMLFLYAKLNPGQGYVQVISKT